MSPDGVKLLNIRQADNAGNVGRSVVLALGWLAFAVVVQRARGIQGEGPQFDPFAILGVSSVSGLQDNNLNYAHKS